MAIWSGVGAVEFILPRRGAAAAAAAGMHSNMCALSNGEIEIPAARFSSNTRAHTKCVNIYIKTYITAGIQLWASNRRRRRELVHTHTRARLILGQCQCARACFCVCMFVRNRKFSFRLAAAHFCFLPAHSEGSTRRRRRRRRHGVVCVFRIKTNARTLASDVGLMFFLHSRIPC